MGPLNTLQVMFYIHGGEFTHGSGNDFPGHQLAAWGQVVVVTVNYRQGRASDLITRQRKSLKFNLNAH